jgi:arylsulfatase A-like enzyme
VKRLLILTTVLVLLTHALAWARQPNVILIMTDDQGFGDMSCHGNPYLQTPSIDKLHEESVRLTDFHVDPTCSPTRAALLTGRYSSRVGVWLTYGGRHHLRNGEITTANVFASAGYRTAIFGKWHLGDNYPFRPQDRGFHESLIHGGGVVGESPDYWGNDYFDDTYFRNGIPESVSGYCTDVWFDEAIRFIERAKDGPFFVYLPTNAPHGPRNVPWEYVEPFLNNPRINEGVARFYGMIVNIDQNVGRLRQRLAELDLSNNTIVIFLTDNGGTGGVRLYNAGMRGSKAKAYEGGHRAACFVHWPAGGLTEGRDIEPITAHIDLLPTLIELCALRSPRRIEFDGKSLVSLLNGNAAPWPERTLFVHHQGRFGQKITDDRPIKYKDFAVMTGRWRLVGKELYDIRADPGQRNDVAADQADVVAELNSAYESWWSDISKRFNEYCPAVIGTDKQHRTVLTCQDWHGEVIPYNQQHVRAGVQANGFWDLEVARDGCYRISLRRWPEEVAAEIGAVVEQGDLDSANIDVNARLYQMPGQAIRATQARLKIGAFDETRPVKTTDKAITLDIELNTGRVNLQTWITDDQGNSWGAYYVYIERLGAAERIPEALGEE